jgi:electron transfer flavoprotein alpha subunit
MADAWVLATSVAGLPGLVQVASGAGPVTVVAVGQRALADAAAAAAGAARVLWVETSADVPAEAVAGGLADLAQQDPPRLVLATAAPAARALLGAVAARVGAAVLGGVREVRAEGAALVVERAALDGAVLETLRTAAPLAGVVAAGAGEMSGQGAPGTPVPGVPVDRVELAPADLRLVERRDAAGGGGVTDAERVVSVGRGVRARADLDLVGQLTAALGAELACSMPVADDLGWVPKERYVGRSGQQISPRLYLALGISGMPQHMEGVRGARVVAAVNSDPQAPIFRHADYGVVGDLYEVVPALVAALRS